MAVAALSLTGEGVERFTNRASLVCGLLVTADNAAAVSQICHRPDGMPPAIEFAVAHGKFSTAVR